MNGWQSFFGTRINFFQRKIFLLPRSFCPPNGGNQAKKTCGAFLKTITSHSEIKRKENKLAISKGVSQSSQLGVMMIFNDWLGENEETRSQEARTPSLKNSLVYYMRSL